MPTLRQLHEIYAHVIAGGAIQSHPLRRSARSFLPGQVGFLLLCSLCIRIIQLSSPTLPFTRARDLVCSPLRCVPNSGGSITFGTYRIAKSARVTPAVGLVLQDGVTIVAVVSAPLATIVIGALVIIIDVDGA